MPLTRRHLSEVMSSTTAFLTAVVNSSQAQLVRFDLFRRSENLFHAGSK